MHQFLKKLTTVTSENLSGSIETKKELRHSRNATQKIFGPLSAKFEPFLQPSSHSHRNYFLFPKQGNSDKGKSGSGYGINYSRNSGYSGQQKRAASSSWDTSRNKMARQASGYTREIPPQEVLKRSKGGFNKQQQFFQGSQGKGKKKYQRY